MDRGTGPVEAGRVPALRKGAAEKSVSPGVPSRVERAGLSNVGSRRRVDTTASYCCFKTPKRHRRGHPCRGRLVAQKNGVPAHELFDIVEIGEVCEDLTLSPLSFGHWNRNRATCRKEQTRDVQFDLGKELPRQRVTPLRRLVELNE